MHELALVSSLIEAVTEDAERRGLKKVTYLSLSVGELSGAGVDSLDFALRHLTSGTILEGADFNIKVASSLCECKKCQQIFKPLPPFFLCPFCRSGQTVITAGRQVYIEFYEGE